MPFPNAARKRNIHLKLGIVGDANGTDGKVMNDAARFRRRYLRTLYAVLHPHVPVATNDK